MIARVLLAPPDAGEDLLVPLRDRVAAVVTRELPLYPGSV